MVMVMVMVMVHLGRIHELWDDINWDGEDDRAVVLCWDAVQGLEVAELRRWWWWWWWCSGDETIDDEDRCIDGEWCNHWWWEGGVLSSKCILCNMKIWKYERPWLIIVKLKEKGGKATMVNFILYLNQTFWSPGLRQGYSQQINRSHRRSVRNNEKIWRQPWGGHLPFGQLIVKKVILSFLSMNKGTQRSFFTVKLKSKFHDWAVANNLCSVS